MSPKRYYMNKTLGCEIKSSIPIGSISWDKIYEGGGKDYFEGDFDTLYLDQTNQELTLDLIEVKGLDIDLELKNVQIFDWDFLTNKSTALVKFRSYDFKWKTKPQ